MEQKTLTLYKKKYGESVFAVWKGYEELRTMKKFCEYLFLWAAGGSVYYAVEMAYRGFSHWSMFVLGGICLCFFAWQGSVSGWRDPFWRQLFRCLLFVTACEFITGLIVNKWLGWQVWDYTGLPLQLWGQICVPFMLVFSGLCAAGILLAAYILWGLFGEEKPRFSLF